MGRKSHRQTLLSLIRKPPIASPAEAVLFCCCLLVEKKKEDFSQNWQNIVCSESNCRKMLLMKVSGNKSAWAHLSWALISGGNRRNWRNLKNLELAKNLDLKSGSDSVQEKWPEDTHGKDACTQLGMFMSPDLTISAWECVFYFLYPPTQDECIDSRYDNAIEDSRADGLFRCPYSVIRVRVSVPYLQNTDAMDNWHYHTLDTVLAEFARVDHPLMTFVLFWSWLGSCSPRENQMCRLIHVKTNLKAVLCVSDRNCT